MTLVFDVPMPPTLTNSGKGRSRHWRAVKRERDAYHATLDTLLVVKRIPSPPPAPLAKATIRSAMKLGGAMDDDNAMARHKWLLDWLVTRGYVVSDRRTCLRWLDFPQQTVKRDGDYRIRLELTPVAPTPDGARPGRVRETREE